MNLKGRFENIQETVRKSNFANDKTHLSNHKKRILYSQLEILRIDIEEALIADNIKREDSLEIEKFLDEIKKLTTELDLKPIRVSDKLNLLYYFEVLIRFIGLVCAFLIIGTVFSLILLIIRVVDEIFQTDPFNYLSEKLKRSISYCLILQSGIEMEVKGLSKELFDSPVSIITFSHASNMDGLLLSATCPLRHIAFGKKELFIVPFFSWISLAYGGLPIDRNNRERALRTMNRCTSSARSSQSKLTIAIAPEGTRSATGQLLPFKKGTFHMVCHI